MSSKKPRSWDPGAREVDGAAGWIAVLGEGPGCGAVKGQEA